MTVLIELKEKLKEFYGSCSGIVLPIVKFLLALAVFRGINSNLGYLKMLNSMYVVLILSLICAILPLNGMVFLAMLVIIGHCFALHMVIAGLAALVLLVLWFLYLRFVPKDAPALLLTPLAFWLHVPSAVPVAYGLAGTPLSAFSAACGVVVYYMCDMIHGKMEPLLHAAEAPEITAVVQEFFNGLFRNEEMLLVLIACALTVLLVNAIRHSSADYAWQISIVAGSVAYAVIMIAGSLALDVQIALPMVLIGAAAGVGSRGFLRTYHTARSRSYYAVPALIYNEIEAKPRTTPFRTATSRSYVGLAVWEDVSITASMKAR